MTNAQLYTIIALAIYATAMALIGFMSAGKSKTLDGFLISGSYYLRIPCALLGGGI